MVTLRSSHRTTAFHQPEARGHFLRFALSQPLSRTHAHTHTRIRTLTRTEKHSTSFQPLSSFRCRLSSFPSPPQPLLPSLSVPVPLNGPSFTLKCSFPPCSGGGKRSRRISRRVCIRLPSSFSPPPLPLPPLPPSAVLAHVERATHTRANTYTHTRARTEIGHAQLSLATHALVSHPHDRRRGLWRRSTRESGPRLSSLSLLTRSFERVFPRGQYGG